jgi:hypothetical protein
MVRASRSKIIQEEAVSDGSSLVFERRFADGVL